MKFRNRLSGEECEDLSGVLLVGLWLAQGQDPAAFIEPGHYVLPTDKQRKLLPEDLESDSIRLLGRHLETLREDENSWLGWNCISPLVPNISEQVEMKALEKFLLSEEAKHLHCLQQVCAQPRTHLQTEVERVHVSRARRADKNAVAYLAAHTEDWEKRTLWGVQPRHILARVRYEDWNIYENRVAARLIDRLLVYLNTRIHALQKILDTLEKRKNYEVGGYYRLQQRVYTLWGEAVQDEQVENYARETLEKLQNLKYLLLGLIGSVLYKQVPRRAQVADHLTMTNILLNDPYYRSVGLAWQEWAKHGAVKQKSAWEKYQDYQDTCQGFNRFCLLLVVRAFDQLGYEPTEDSLETPLDGSKPLMLQGRHGQVGLRIKANGLIELTNQEANQTHLRVVPILAALGEQDAVTQEQVYLELGGYLSRDPQPAPLTLILYPDEANDNLPLCLHGLPHESAGLFENLGVLPVSPWEIASVEHVARALRWVLAGSLIKNYPPLIKTEKPLELSRTPDCLVQREKNCWALSEPSPPQESNWLQNELNNQESTVSKLRQQLEDERQAGRNPRRSGHQRVTERDKQLQVEYKKAEDHLSTFKDFQQQLLKAQQYYQHLLYCPVCEQGHFNTPGFLKKRDQDTFFCKCQCGTQWELRSCHACHERYPILLPSVDLSDNRPTGWLDKSLGMDVLTVPMGAEKFLCPSCFQS